MLSKGTYPSFICWLTTDHFSCYLNEPAGKVAIVIVRHAVQQVVSAWSDPSIDPNRAIDSILTVFCHPSLLIRNNPVQMEMFGVVERWINSCPEKDKVLQRLTKEGVRAGRHHSSERKNAMRGYAVTGGHSHGGGQHSFGGYIPPSQGTMPGYGYQGGGGIGTSMQQAQETFGGSHVSGGGGVGSYVQQAGQALQSGGGGIGNFVQNVTGQMTGGRRRESNDDYSHTVSPKDRLGSGYQPPYPLEPQYDESREQHGRPNPPYPQTLPIQEQQGRPNPPYPQALPIPEQHGRPIPPYPRTPPIPQDYGQERRQQPHEPPFESPFGQSLYGYNTQPPERPRPPYPDN
jgi:Heterokaryon incompatibility protein Het-C